MIELNFPPVFPLALFFFASYCKIFLTILNFIGDFMTRYYVRVSSLDQRIDRQLLAYDKADRTYIDRMSGVNRDRPELNRLLSDLREGDIVVVKSVDRLSRSAKDFLDISEHIKLANAHLKILDLNIDTSSPVGECVLTILAAISQMERNTIKQRTAEGIAIAKANGKYTGRKVGAIALNSQPSIDRFKRLFKAGLSKSELAREFNVSRPTIYHWIKILKQRRILK